MAEETTEETKSKSRSKSKGSSKSKGTKEATADHDATDAIEAVHEEEAKIEKAEEKAKPKLKRFRPKDRLKAGTKWIETLFDKMQLDGIEVEANVGDKVLEYNVHGGDAHMLLGPGRASAKALESIQTIMREALTGGYDTNYSVHIDVDNFRQRRTEHLEEVARGLATAATQVGDSITVAGFNSFERRVVHQALSENHAVTTDSEGRGSFRKLRVDPLS